MKRCGNCGCMINIGTPCHNCGYISLSDTFTCQICGIQTDKIYVIKNDEDDKKEVCETCYNTRGSF